MFYDFVLLRRQNQGRFAMAWVASTRGIQTVIREFGANKIREIDIFLLCEETMEYLVSTSNNPKERVSLRMAVHLIQGTIILFSKKVSLFQDDLSTYFNRISTFPKVKAHPRRKKDRTQRIFTTPPTPVIKEKGRKKRDSVAPTMGPIMEEFLRVTTELEAGEVLSRAVGAPPSEVEARKESLDILQAQPLQVVIPEDLFGEFDVISTRVVPQIPPQVPPSEASEKSQLDKIEEMLMAEQIAEYAEVLRHKEREAKKSSSSSVGEGPRTIQVEAMVHRDAVAVEPEKERPQKGSEDSSSSGVQQGAVMIVEATVHRSAEGEQEPIQTGLQPSAVFAVPQPMEIVEDIQPVKEAAITAETTEQAEIEKQIQSVLGKESRPKKRPALKQLQQDEIPTQEVRTPRRSQKEEQEKKEKEEKIAKLLRMKFRPARRVLHLDDFDKITRKEVFSVQVFGEYELLTGALADFIMGISPEMRSVDEVTIEQMRKEPSSRSFSTDALRRSSKVASTMTPLEPPSRSPSQRLTQPMVVPASGDFVPEFNVEMIGSTPYRGDTVAMPQKKLYEETRVEYDFPVPQAIDIYKDKIVEAEPIVLEQIEREPQLPPTYSLSPTKRQEEEARMKKIKERLKLWDETEGYLLVDDIIPRPKNRMNAAKTFFLLLRLAKEKAVILIPEENSLELKYVKKGVLLQ